jgi:hypothetical protein
MAVALVDCILHVLARSDVLATDGAPSVPVSDMVNVAVTLVSALPHGL